MFTSIETNTTQMMQMMYKMQFNRNALLKDQFATLIMSLIICYLVVEFMSDIICTNICAKIETKYKNEHKGLVDDLNKRDDEIQSLLIEICNLHEELKTLKEIKETNQETESDKPQNQCNKCFNEYDKDDIKEFYITRNLLQHYCKDCYDTNQ